MLHFKFSLTLSVVVKLTLFCVKNVHNDSYILTLYNSDVQIQHCPVLNFYKWVLHQLCRRVKCVTLWQESNNLNKEWTNVDTCKVLNWILWGLNWHCWICCVHWNGWVAILGLGAWLRLGEGPYWVLSLGPIAPQPPDASGFMHQHVQGMQG